MIIQILQHAEGEWIGSMKSWFDARGDTLRTTRLDHNEAVPAETDFDWLLVMGGPMSVNDESEFPWLAAEKILIRQAIDHGLPVLGICLGGQLIANALGARVYVNSEKEIGWWPVNRTDAVAQWMPQTLHALSWHGECFEVPDGATSFACSTMTPSQGFCYGDRVWALQFHLEAEPGTVEAFYACETAPLPDARYVQSVETMLDAAPQLEASAKAIHALLEQIAHALPTAD